MQPFSRGFGNDGDDFGPPGQLHRHLCIHSTRSDVFNTTFQGIPRTNLHFGSSTQASRLRRDVLHFSLVYHYWSSQRPAAMRERTSTAAAIPTNNTASARAADKSVSNAAIMAKDMVCVRPAKFPANISVAPNSDTARARQRTIPLVIPGSASGRVTYQKRPQAEAPSIAAASSSSGSTAANPSLAPRM